MERRNILKEVEAAIKNRPDSYTGRWRLIFADEKIICLPVRFHYKQDQYIRDVNLQEVEDGFTPKEWVKIAEQVLRLIERTKKRQLPQKPLL
jgi:predicted Ser/Thr protein kinase